MTRAVSDRIRAFGFALGTGGPTAVDIDQDWSREHYLRHKRSFVAVATGDYGRVQRNAREPGRSTELPIA